MLHRAAALLAVCALAGGLAACATSGLSRLPEGQTRLETARALYERGDYRRCILETNAFLADSPGSRYLDEATMLLGKAYYEEGDFFAAEERFRRIKRDFPESELAEDASYFLALALLSQSRPAELDQAETEEALVEFQSFITRYPDHPNVERARGHMRDARAKLAEKQYKNGITYSKVKSYAAARHQFQQVVTLFPETPWACPAMYRLVKSFERTQDWSGVSLWAQRLVDEAPDCQYAADAREMLDKALREQAAGEAPEADSSASVSPDGKD